MALAPEQKAFTGVFDQDLAQLEETMHVPLSEDVIEREFTAAGKRAALFYVDGMADDEKLQRFLLLPCLRASPPGDTPVADYFLERVLAVGSVKLAESADAAVTRVFNGDAALLVDGVRGALVADVKGFAKRGVQQPINEAVIVGPQEGFTESLRDNVTLMRRIMRTPSLISEQCSVGARIPTRLCLLYLNGVAREETVREIRRRIEGCNVDYVSSAGMLEQLLEDDPFALLPQIVSTERPDRAASFLLEGQVLVAMENSPQMMSMPIDFLHLFHAPDDMGMRWQYGTFLRVIRLLGLLVAVLLPGVFVALTLHHMEGMPLALLTSVIESQARVPLAIFPATLFMLAVFSLINEAGTRVPGMMGGVLGIVSALILGQAAVEADLVSPLLIIVVALAGLGSFAIPDYSLSVAVRILQIVLLLAGSLGGYMGLVAALFVVGVRLCGMTSLGFPFLAPWAPPRPANPDSVLRLPVWRQRLRSFIANPFELRRAKGRMRAWDKERRP